jgi:DNA-binding response OmpR family regulator
VLIADDDSDTLLTLSAILADDGYTVHTVSRGDHVLDAVRRYKPDACILDIEMPGKSGYAAAQELTNSLRSECPLLVGISGIWTRASERLLAQSVGFDHFLTKPADPNELVEILENLSEGKADAK